MGPSRRCIEWIRLYVDGGGAGREFPLRVKAWRWPLRESHQLSARVGRRLGAAWVYWWRGCMA